MQEDPWYNIIGHPGTPHRLKVRLAAIFVLVWFAMDTVEFADWVVSKFKEEPPCAPVTQFIPYGAPPSWFQQPPDPTRNRGI